MRDIDIGASTDPGLNMSDFVHQLPAGIHTADT